MFYMQIRFEIKTIVFVVSDAMHIFFIFLFCILLFFYFSISLFSHFAFLYFCTFTSLAIHETRDNARISVGIKVWQRSLVKSKAIYQNCDLLNCQKCDHQMCSYVALTYVPFNNIGFYSEVEFLNIIIRTKLFLVNRKNTIIPTIE